MHEPTPDLVRRFSAFLLAHFGARLFDKRTARGMKATAALLERLGVADAQFFLEQQPTTLGKRIYVPFALGVPDGSWPLWRQMVTLVHECQHVRQFERLGALSFAWTYLASQSGRTHLEVEGFWCQLEMHFWRFGVLPPIGELAQALRHFGIRESGVQLGEALLRVASEGVKHGAVANEASRTALSWLSKNAPHLRSKVSPWS